MPHVIFWQRAEASIIFLVGLVLFWHWSDTIPWWAAIAIFFAPDLSFVGYLMGPRVGSFVYNIVHVYALGAVLLAIGLTASVPLLAAIGALWLGHAGFDRMLGYGLKLPDGFSSTHLGQIGRKQ